MSGALHRTTDPYFASFLLSQGAYFDGCTRLGPKTVEYRFAADERLHGLLRLYAARLPVEVVPASLFDALRTLKKRTLPD